MIFSALFLSNRSKFYRIDHPSDCLLFLKGEINENVHLLLSITHQESNIVKLLIGDQWNFRATFLLVTNLYKVLLSSIGNKT